ncbi:hypothetical protein F4802DRAFT_409759 [Xylaria palmicola]|nr:hypothetical protein F4802DRAFT_409759 [Xylaria palmicola]
MDLNNNPIPGPPNGRVIPPTELGDQLAPDNFGPSVEVCVWSLAILAGGWLALRLYLKFRRHRGLWWDDHALAISWVCIVLANACTSIAISLGWGQQIYDLPVENFPYILVALYISGAFSILAAALSKSSFALTLLRISNGWVRYVVWFAMITINIVMSLSIIFNFVQCTPVEKNFNVFIPGSCWPRRTLSGYNIFVAAYSGVMDILLALLPWKVIWNMDMSRKERFGAICAMSLGLLAGTISLVKISALAGVFQANLNSSMQLVVLSIAETAVTIMAASIPILRALARDKASRRGINLFTLNATGHLTLQRQPEPQPDDPDDELLKNQAGPKGIPKLSGSASGRRDPVLSKIPETEELSPGLFAETTTVERSFV